MIKVEVIKDFSLKEFNKLKNIIRKDESKKEKGKLYEGDTFECDKEMCEYLTGKNPIREIVVKTIEVEPEKENKEEPKIIETIETSVGTFGYSPVEVKTTKPKSNKKKKKK